MSKLYLPIGLIGSGKSTWAKGFIIEHPDVKIVAGDDIRRMLSNEYVYDKKSELSIIQILIDSTITLLNAGYDVILDECYCSLNVNLRKAVADSLRLTARVELIAVVFPLRDMKDHIDDKIMKGLRGKTINYWKRVFNEMKKIFQPFDIKSESYFDKKIEVSANV